MRRYAKSIPEMKIELVERLMATTDRFDSFDAAEAYVNALSGGDVINQHRDVCETPEFPTEECDENL